jgi:uncharacterized FlaG/YvyC family protein
MMQKYIDTEEFINKCSEEVKKYYKDTLNFDIDETSIVWYSKNCQNHKCTMIAFAPDSMYFEFTYNGDYSELYMDVYTKTTKKIIEL